MLGLIIKREFTTLLGSKAMRISTAVIVILCLAAGVAGNIFLGDDNSDDQAIPEATSVAITSEANALTPYLEQLGVSVEETSGNPDDVARDSGNAVISGSPAAPTITSTDGADPIRDVVVLAATEKLMDEAGALTPDVSASLAALASTTVTSVATDAFSENPIGYAVGMVGVLMLMMVTLMGISTLSAGVVEEKASRVVEILLTTVRPRTLLLGKILGIGSAMLVIFAVYLAGILGGLWIAGLLDQISTLGALGVWGYVPMLLLWIVLGYFTFAGITGGISATVSRQEDLGAVQTPLIFMQMIPLYLAIYLVPYLPDATVTKVLSYVPLFSPYLMPMRAAVGGVEVWEQVLAIALTLITIPLLALVAGKIYERSILHTGERIKLKQVLRKAA